jgi:hypothetical protein
MAAHNPDPEQTPHNTARPRTEAFAMQFGQTSAASFMALPDSDNEELQPTRDALVDVYNRDFPADNTERVLF